MSAFEDIGRDPLIGHHLPFPWQPGVLGHNTGEYWITYKIAEDTIIDIQGVTLMPDVEELRSP